LAEKTKDAEATALRDQVKQSLLHANSDLVELGKANTFSTYVQVSKIPTGGVVEWLGLRTTSATQPTAPDKPTDK
jgi:hypothetical protein